MLKRIKPLSKSTVDGIVYQIRYLINEKNLSDKALAYRLRNILSDNGIPVSDDVKLPKPWEWTNTP